MSNANSIQHIYQRTVNADGLDSLSIIAKLIEPGQTLLDLGMGTGGLGKHLSSQRVIVADGVTLNQAEADIAGQWYRHVKVADLDQANLAELFDGERYDCIVCADVLEHLKAPQNLMAHIRSLLKPDGRLITSVPNAGYCGLVAELMQGEFRYRPEGLLDATHLRFFTRASLERFFDECGWRAQSIMTTQRALLASEFKVAFDSMPPAVTRYLLAMPDALSYQFIGVLQPAEWGPGPAQEIGSRFSNSTQSATAVLASFSAQLYLATQGEFNERAKLVCAGQIGVGRQCLGFDIPNCTGHYSAIRLDPADRPGFFKLYGLRLSLSSGDVIFQWNSQVDSLDLLKMTQNNQILWQQPWELSDSALLFLYGDDPWFELPLAVEMLRQVSQTGALLEIDVGWPMSADYLAASIAMNEQQKAHQRSSAQLQAEQHAMVQTCANLQAINAALSSQMSSLNVKLTTTERSLHDVRTAKRALTNDLTAAQRTSQIRLKQYEDLLQHLQTIERSTVFRATRPIVSVKMKLDRWLGKTPPSTHHDGILEIANTNGLQLPVPSYPVDIIVPVYRGLDDTRCCIESVLNANCATLWRLIIINDCSPEPAVTEWLRSMAKTDARIELLENTENLGFVATVNRGMAMSATNDVLLLNSDAEVANDWLDRIQRAAYSNARVASVTPFSNNATICSYPRFCMGNELPAGHTTATLDKVFADTLTGRTVAVPTGVGFCMYIRRDCLADVGMFDVANFGKGYGEENDFCMRAQAAGWTNLHALDTFVRHAGGISFGDSKSERELLAGQAMERLHPGYERDIQLFVASDPAKSARLAIDLARICSSGKPVILNVIHDREGGTLRHLREMSVSLADQATFLRLSPVQRGVKLRLEGPSEAFVMHFETAEISVRLVNVLKRLGVGHIHYHHLLGYPPIIAELPNLIGVTHDFTAHDYYSYCPQVSLTDHSEKYCGELGIEQCRQCLIRHPAPAGESIESWRSRHAGLLTLARYVIAPSIDTAKRMARFVPTASIRVVPHADLESAASLNPQPVARQLTPPQPLKVAVLGALSKFKGADTLENVAVLAAKRGLPMEFHLLGYAYRSLKTQPKAYLTVHGGYEEKDLPLLLDWLKPDIVWFAAQCPETYSYTLSASLASGLPVVAPNIGAFSERLQNRAWTWLCDWTFTADQWLDFFEEIRNKNFVEGVAPSPFSQIDQISSFSDVQMHYSADYCSGLPSSRISEKTEFFQLCQEISEAMQIENNAGPDKNKTKKITLKLLKRMRFNPLFSKFAKYIPMHLQRRTKSWLNQ